MTEDKPTPKPTVPIRMTPERYREDRGDVEGWHYGSAFGFAEGKPTQGEL